MKRIGAERRRGLILSSILGSAVCVAGVPGYAQAPGTRLNWGVDAGLGFTDNVFRTPRNEQSETIALVGGAIDLSHASGMLRASVVGNLGWQEYLNGTASGEVVGRIDGNAALAIIPDRLVWDVDNSFGQVRNNPYEALTPANRENVNYFSTGPRLALHLGDSAQLVLGGRYANTLYEESPYDSNRYSATAALSYATSPRRHISLNATTERYDFDDTVRNRNYDKQEYFARFETRGSRTNLALDAGYTTLDDGVQTADGIIGRLYLSRALSRLMHLSLNAGTEFSDAGNIFRNRGEMEYGGIDVSTVLATTTAFENRFANLTWSLARDRSTFTAHAHFADENYDTDLSRGALDVSAPTPAQPGSPVEFLPLLDRQVYGGRLEFGRQLRPQATLRIYAEGFSERFDLEVRDVDERRLGVGLVWRLNRSIGLMADVARVTRSTTFGDADENRMTVRVAYMANGGRSDAEEVARRALRNRGNVENVERL